MINNVIDHKKTALPNFLIVSLLTKIPLNRFMRNNVILFLVLCTAQLYPVQNLSGDLISLNRSEFKPVATR